MLCRKNVNIRDKKVTEVLFRIFFFPLHYKIQMLMIKAIIIIVVFVVAGVFAVMSAFMRKPEHEDSEAKRVNLNKQI